MINAALFKSDSAEWGTPQALYDKLDEEFRFKLDPCATDENAKCIWYYTKQENGLIQPWHDAEKVFMNPPYGREVGQWVKKAYEEAQKGATVVCLLPARTDTKWFHRYIWDKEKHQPREGVQVRLLEGRLKFGGAKNSAPFPSMIIVFRKVQTCEN